MNKLHLIVAAIFVLSLPGVEGASASNNEAHPSAAIENPQANTESWLNADGTLNLESGYEGSLDLSGWDVELDSERGPVFAKSASGQAAPLAPLASLAAPAYGHWGDIGGGGGPALNSMVRAVAVLGHYVYVGGSFADAASVPEADNFAKWDAVSGAWSGVGCTGCIDPPLTGSVLALAVDGTNLYVGGAFENVQPAGPYVPAADYVVRYDTVGDTWHALGADGSGDGSLKDAVTAILVSAGSVYVGGTFTDVWDGSTQLPAADYIARWDTVGGHWYALGGSGGTTPNGSISGGAPATSVSALAAYGQDIYVGGEFHDVKDGLGTKTAADHIARWNTDTEFWYALGSNGASEGSLNDTVTALAVDGSGKLYVGGLFENVNNNGTELTAADHVAKWDPTVVDGWSALGGDGGGTPDGSITGNVTALVISGGDLYVGGAFNDVKNGLTTLHEADGIARWDGSQWHNLSSDGAGDGSIWASVNALAVNGSKVYVGGGFPFVNDNGTMISHAARIAQWDSSGGGSWSALGAAQGSLMSEVRAIAISGTDVYVGGQFRDVVSNGTPIPEADFIARWDGTEWHALGTGGSAVGALVSGVLAIAVSGTDVYVGGNFTYLLSASHPNWEGSYIAKYDTLSGTWSALGSDGNSGNYVGSINNSVYALAIKGSELYAAGRFTNVTNNDGIAMDQADYVAKWDGAKWSALGNNGSAGPSLNYWAYALAVVDPDVYVGGAFTDVTNEDGNPMTAADYIARWDGAAWHELGSNGSGNGSLNSTVFALAASGTDLYAGGSFTNVMNGTTPLSAADFIAKWDTTGISGWSALGDNGFGDGSLKEKVLALAVYGTNLYVGGDFEDVWNAGTELTAADSVVRWDGHNWSALGSDGAGDGSVTSPENHSVKALAATQRQVYAGGYFFNVEDNGAALPYADYAAVYYTVPNTATFRSGGSNDGWVLESGETTNAGGTKNSGSMTFRLGDSPSNQQYRSILHFNTSSLSDTVTVVGINLKIKRQGSTGTNPFKSLQTIKVDIRRGSFGTSALQLTDFQAKASLNGAGTITNAPVLSWYSTDLLNTSFTYLNLTGVTQLRLRFKRDDNNNSAANYLSFYSGNAGSSSRPVLTISYFP